MSSMQLLLQLLLQLYLQLMQSHCYTTAAPLNPFKHHLASKSQPSTLAPFDEDDDDDSYDYNDDNDENDKNEDDDANENDDDGYDLDYEESLRSKKEASISCYECTQKINGDSDKCFYSELNAVSDTNAEVAIKTGCKSCSFIYVFGTQIRQCDTYAATEEFCTTTRFSAGKPIFTCYCTNELCNFATYMRGIMNRTLDPTTYEMVWQEVFFAPKNSVANSSGSSPVPALASKPKTAPAVTAAAAAKSLSTSSINNSDQLRDQLLGSTPPKPSTLVETGVSSNSSTSKEGDQSTKREKDQWGLDCYECTQEEGQESNTQCYFADKYQPDELGSKSSVRISKGCHSCAFIYTEGKQERRCERDQKRGQSCGEATRGEKSDKPIFTCYCDYNLCNGAASMSAVMKTYLNNQTFQNISKELLNPPSLNDTRVSNRSLNATQQKNNVTKAGQGSIFKYTLETAADLNKDTKNADVNPNNFTTSDTNKEQAAIAKPVLPTNKMIHDFESVDDTVLLLSGDVTSQPFSEASAALPAAAISESDAGGSSQITALQPASQLALNQPAAQSIPQPASQQAVPDTALQSYLAIPTPSPEALAAYNRLPQTILSGPPKTAWQPAPQWISKQPAAQSIQESLPTAPQTVPSAPELVLSVPESVPSAQSVEQTEPYTSASGPYAQPSVQSAQESAPSVQAQSRTVFQSSPTGAPIAASETVWAPPLGVPIKTNPAENIPSLTKNVGAAKLDLMSIWSNYLATKKDPTAPQAVPAEPQSVPQNPGTTAVGQAVPQATERLQTVPVAVPQAVPQTVSQIAQQAVTQTVSQVVPQAIPQARPQAVQQVVPPSIQQEVPQTVPMTVSQAVRQTVSLVAQQAETQTVSQAVPQIVSQARPQAVSQAVQQVIPQALPEAVAAVQTVPQAKHYATGPAQAAEESLTKTSEPVKAAPLATGPIHSVPQTTNPVKSVSQIRLPVPTPVQAISTATAPVQAVPQAAKQKAGSAAVQTDSAIPQVSKTASSFPATRPDANAIHTPLLALSSSDSLLTASSSMASQTGLDSNPAQDGQDLLHSLIAQDESSPLDSELAQTGTELEQEYSKVGESILEENYSQAIETPLATNYSSSGMGLGEKGLSSFEQPSLDQSKTKLEGDNSSPIDYSAEINQTSPLEIQTTTVSLQITNAAIVASLKKSITKSSKLYPPDLELMKALRGSGWDINKAKSDSLLDYEAIEDWDIEMLIAEKKGKSTGNVLKGSVIICSLFLIVSLIV